MASLNRLSQHLRTADYRMGSRSPNSIPSSPTSVHSSSSAIFERDIEPIVSPSPPHKHSRDPHSIPRAKTTEQLEQNVPSVLDTAASILASGSDSNQVAVVTPATSLFERTSGFPSPIGSFRSRSPSPLGTRSPGIILNIPQPAIAIPKPVVQTETIVQGDVATGTPSIVTPTSAHFTMPSSSESSPRQAREHSLPHRSLSASPPPTASAAQSPISHAHPAASHPPSPHHPTKRLSFMSYSDLLTSTPASTLPLTSLTTSASSVEPPPHIPTVSGFTYSQAQAHQHPHFHHHSTASAGTSVRGLSLSPVSPTGSGHVVHGPGGKRDSIALLEDVGGEWEREGMGRGLEERLEALMPIGARS